VNYLTSPKNKVCTKDDTCTVSSDGVTYTQPQAYCKKTAKVYQSDQAYCKVSGNEDEKF